MQEDDEVTNNYSIKKFRIDEVYKTSDELDFSLIGSVYHKIMEHINFELKTLEEIKSQIQKLIDNNILPINTFELVDAQKILLATLKIAELMSGASEVKREQQFMMFVPYNEVFKNSDVTDKILIQGVIDLIIIKKEEARIVDFKTTRMNEPADLVKKYATQLELYKKAYEKASEKVVFKKLIYSFHLNNIVNV